MKTLIYLFIGIFLGVVLIKSQAASWFRIYEMFSFQSFHMYGIICTAIFFGAIFTYGIKKLNLKSIYGKPIKIEAKEKTVIRYLIGGGLFGLGWALTGACPGPLFALAGSGFWMIGIVILSSVFGTYLYGVFKSKLPH